MQSPKNSTKAHLQSTQHIHKRRVTLTHTDTYIHTVTFTHWVSHTYMHTFHTSLWANKAEWQKRGWDKWYNDIQAWLVSRVEREDEEDEEEEGQAVVALNTGIILQRLTVSTHITLKLWPGNVEREGEREVGEALRGSYNDHTLLSHSPSLLSAPYSLALASHSLFCSSTWSLTSFPPSLPRCVCSFGLSRQGWVAFRERVHSFALSLSLLLSSLSLVKARGQLGPLGMSQNH